MTVLLITCFIVGFVLTIVMQRLSMWPYVGRWTLLDNKKPRPHAVSTAPHERWPEILHWRKGDQFENTYGLNHSMYSLVAVQEDGYAVVEFCGDRDWAPIAKLVGHNKSLRTRVVNEDLKQSNEYMELINQFHISFKELQERDKRNGIAATPRTE